jgi:hypothetical protein
MSELNYYLKEFLSIRIFGNYMLTNPMILFLNKNEIIVFFTILSYTSYVLYLMMRKEK